MHMRLLSALGLACYAFAQGPAFEVASVKRSEPITPELVQAGRVQMGVSIDARNVRMSKMSLFDLITLAFQVKPHQVSAPPWITTLRFDVQAKLPDGASRGQVPAMLQTLLADRFGMKIHRETRDFNVLALLQAKGGHKLKTSTDDPTAEPAAPSPQIRGGVSVGPDGAQTHTGPGGDSRITPGPNGSVRVETRRMTMKAFAEFLARYCDRPVVDMTGAAGLFDAGLDVSAEEMRSAARAHGANVGKAPEEPSDPAGPSLMSSLQKLGLRLEGRKSPAEVIVVDALERAPTEN
jgi:uncharacterized protein (TIGR03435 family)